MKATRLLALLCAAAAMLAVPSTRAQTARPGPVIAVGGALRADNEAVWRRIVDEAGGANARFVVIAAASEEPEESAGRVIARLKARGASAEHLPVAPLLKGSDYRAAARDPALVARIAQATGVYFTGGAQGRILQALLDEQGAQTPVLAAIRALHARGGLVAGSSAGTAVLSHVMFVDPPGVLEIMKSGVRKPTDAGPGLGFLPAQVIVDQHALRRGRLGRLVRLLQDERLSFGVAVEENAAALFRGNEVEALGSAGVLFVDMRQASSDPRVPRFNLRDARLSLLNAGDRFDLATGEVRPSPAKLAGSVLDPATPGYSPEFANEAFYPDVLAPGVLAGAMEHLLDSRQQDVRGVAFGSPYGHLPELGFEFRLAKRAGSKSYTARDAAGGDTCVIDVQLDITPVLRNLPLYRPVPPGPSVR